MLGLAQTTIIEFFMVSESRAFGMRYARVFACIDNYPGATPIQFPHID